VPLISIERAVLADKTLDYHYLCPLLPRFFVQYLDPPLQLPNPHWGPYQIVHVTPSYDIEEMWDPIIPLFDENSTSTEFVPNVHRLAVVNSQFIIGESEDLYFILDTVGPSLRTFDSARKYRAALVASNLGNSSMVEPGQFAKKVANKTLRPWMYRAMDDALGLSDLAWCRISEDCGLLIAIIVGIGIPIEVPLKMLCYRRLLGLTLGAIFGFIVASIADGWMISSGPDTFVAQICLPPEYSLATFLVGEIVFCTFRSWLVRREPQLLKQFETAQKLVRQIWERIR